MNLSPADLRFLFKPTLSTGRAHFQSNLRLDALVKCSLGQAKGGYFED